MFPSQGPNPLARIVEHNDVDDAIILPFGTIVAFGTDNDETVVHHGPCTRIPRGEPSVLGGQRPRDQNAVAYDPATDTLYTGGNDSAVWTISGICAGTPKSRLRP